MKTPKVLKLVSIVLVISFLFACSGVSKATLKKFTAENPKMYVCPVHILSNQQSSFDSVSANAIVDFINKNEYADASLTQLKPVANNQWLANEAKMVTESNTLFTEFVLANKFPENSYILYAEFLKGGPDETVRAVHYYLLNNQGEAAMRGLINSVWKEFQEVNPQTNEDCVAVFIKGFENKLKNR